MEYSLKKGNKIMNKLFAEYTRSVAFSISLSQRMIEDLFIHTLYCDEAKRKTKQLKRDNEPWGHGALSRRGLVEGLALTEAGEIMISLLTEAEFSQDDLFQEMIKNKKQTPCNKFAEYTRSTTFSISLSNNMIGYLFMFGELTEAQLQRAKKCGLWPYGAEYNGCTRALSRRGLIDENHIKITKAGKILINLLELAGFKSERQEAQEIMAYASKLSK